MAPLPDALLALLPRSFLANTNHAPTINSDTRSLSPREVQMLHLAKRGDRLIAEHAAGARPPTDFNNKGFQVLFALIGMGMVLTAIWFFFWAKNGGFHFKDDDWEDYKSTVLRRKGPDGKTLSNATKSTRLGGGSVVHGGSYGESSVGYTDETATSADHGEMREVEEGHGRHFGLRGGDAAAGKKKKHRREGTNNYKDNDLRGYREERPARVGGLNRQADGVYTDYSTTNGSALGSNVSSQPLVAPTDKKKDAKAKEIRARERMRQAKLIEKNAAKTAAAEAKAQKTAEKERAKKDKEQQKMVKKTRRTETEATPSEAAYTEAPRTEAAYTETAYTEATPSEAPMSEAPMTEAKRHSRRAPPSAAYSFITGDDTNTVYSGAYTDNRTAPSEAAETSYYSDYRPHADPAVFSSPETRPRRERQSQAEPRTQSRHSSPRKPRASRQSAASDIFTQTNGNQQGTISYPCHIPGLSTAGSVAVSDSISQVAGRREARRGRDVMDGYRRAGGRNRRDSLSDSDS